MAFRIGDAAAARLKEAHPFISFVPLFAWHFRFWFAPTAAPFADLLSADTAASWLAYLATSVVALLAEVESYCFLLWGERLSSLSYRGTSTDAVVRVI